MAAPSLLPGKDQLRRELENGDSHATIAERYSVSLSAVQNAVNKYGLGRRAWSRHSEYVPWTVPEEFRYNKHVRYLRSLGRRRSGTELAEAENRRLDKWLSDLREADAVVGYSLSKGIVLVARRDEDGSWDDPDFIPIHKS